MQRIYRFMRRKRLLLRLNSDLLKFIKILDELGNSARGTLKSQERYKLSVNSSNR